MARRTKPHVNVNPVANRYVGLSERIIEFSFADGTGGLIVFSQFPDGQPSVHVYRVDPSVRISIERTRTLSRAEVANGTGFPAGTRFLPIPLDGRHEA